MHDCIECENACDCDGEDTWNDAATEDCEGCGCVDDNFTYEEDDDDF